MFPAGYYYGGPLNEQIGPKNAIIPQAEVDLHPTATLGITLKALFVWREDTADGLYDTPGFLILPGSSNSHRYVGASPQVLITQQLGRPGRIPDQPTGDQGCRLFFYLDQLHVLTM